MGGVFRVSRATRKIVNGLALRAGLYARAARIQTLYNIGASAIGVAGRSFISDYQTGAVRKRIDRAVSRLSQPLDLTTLLKAELQYQRQAHDPGFVISAIQANELVKLLSPKKTADPETEGKPVDNGPFSLIGLSLEESRLLIKSGLSQEEQRIIARKLLDIQRDLDETAKDIGWNGWKLWFRYILWQSKMITGSDFLASIIRGFTSPLI